MTPSAKKATPSLSSILNNEEEDKQKPVDSTPETDQPELDRDEDYTEEENDIFLSPSVVATVPNKTPAELAAETPDETAARYGVDTSITEEDANNPKVQVYKDTYVKQVPSGTHLHPDVAKDLSNRGISQHTTDSAQVKREITDTYDFAPDAEHNDKFQKSVEDRDEDVAPNAGSTN